VHKLSVDHRSVVRCAEFDKNSTAEINRHGIELSLTFYFNLLHIFPFSPVWSVGQPSTTPDTLPGIGALFILYSFLSSFQFAK
jgi:hypothetical protein